MRHVLDHGEPQLLAALKYRSLRLRAEDIQYATVNAYACLELTSSMVGRHVNPSGKWAGVGTL